LPPEYVSGSAFTIAVTAASVTAGQESKVTVSCNNSTDAAVILAATDSAVLSIAPTYTVYTFTVAALAGNAPGDVITVSLKRTGTAATTRIRVLGVAYRLTTDF